MKLHALGASAVALALAFSSPAKATAARDFVLIATTTGITILKCPNYDAVEGGLVKYGDSIGVDVDRYGPPVAAALRVISDMPYNRGDLVPEVTQVVRNAIGELQDNHAKLGDKKFCRKYGDFLESIGVMRRKF